MPSSTEIEKRVGLAVLGVLLVAGATVCEYSCHEHKKADAIGQQVIQVDQRITSALAQAESYKAQAITAMAKADEASKKASRAEKREAALKAQRPNTEPTPGIPDPDLKPLVDNLQKTLDAADEQIAALKDQNSHQSEALALKDLQIGKLEVALSDEQKARSLERIQADALVAAAKADGWKRTIKGVTIGFAGGVAGGLYLGKR
jgi:chromosome segregation ATPase